MILLIHFVGLSMVVNVLFEIAFSGNSSVTLIAKTFETVVKDESFV